ncbi:MAG: imidazole glycerol phosphate synthase subunit HisH [Bowdeniella nasicola]|nr:imidazole glycerol phosphate synthase subunit HisH [Bowdeniella nasicola]
MGRPDVVVLNYGSGNVRSVCRALERAGAEVELTEAFDRLLEAQGLVVPGVGAYAACMSALRAVHAPRAIERRLAGGRAVLGICVGLQVMFDGGNEHGSYTEGLGQWPGDVTRLRADVVPHMGWSSVTTHPDSELLAGLGGQRFYFVHSYAAHRDPADLLGPSKTRKPRTSFATHGETFVAAVENGPLCATQFHPEKSGDVGAEVLTRWVRALL